MDTILVVNAGSSSVKFQVFGADAAGGLERLIKGQMDGIAARPRLRAAAADGTPLIDEAYAAERVADVPTALALAGAWLRDTQKLEPIAVGHRVVHGGPDYDRPVVIDDKVLAGLERYVSLAPLHQPNNLAPIRSILARAPDLPQVACFDTAFHRTMPEVAGRFALPEELHAAGLRRYGFHGLSYEFVASALRSLDPAAARGRSVAMHLGNGASMCALLDGRSVATTMGFSVLDGLCMGTRPGALDPGVLLWLADERGLDPRAIEHLLYDQSGLLGVSGITSDMEALLASPDPRARLAVDLFVYRIGRELGSLAAALGGLDAIVFTAGIGEHTPVVRERVCRQAAWLGVELDADANAAGGPRISTASSRASAWVIPTNEELMIARHTRDLLRSAA
jgi:acetate kinase